MKNFFKKGSFVMYEYEERRTNAFGMPYMAKEYKPAIVIENPRDEYGQFTSDFEWKYGITVKIKFEDGETITTELKNVYPDVSPCSLTIEELKELRKQICGGSLYYGDYNNTLGVFNRTASDYYDGFWEYISSEHGEDAEKYDTPEEFACYCYGTEYYRPSSLSA